jgi:hypothetical protein
MRLASGGGMAIFPLLSPHDWWAASSDAILEPSIAFVTAPLNLGGCGPAPWCFASCHRDILFVPVRENSFASCRFLIAAMSHAAASGETPEKPARYMIWRPLRRIRSAEIHIAGCQSGGFLGKVHGGMLRRLPRQ